MAAPPPPSRFNELMDMLKAEYDRISSENHGSKDIRREWNRKIEEQAGEINAMLNEFRDLERKHALLKDQYEQELLRLKGQVPTAAGAAGTASAVAAGVGVASNNPASASSLGNSNAQSSALPNPLKPQPLPTSQRPTQPASSSHPYSPNDTPPAHHALPTMLASRSAANVPPSAAASANPNNASSAAGSAPSSQQHQPNGLGTVVAGSPPIATSATINTNHTAPVNSSPPQQQPQQQPQQAPTSSSSQPSLSQRIVSMPLPHPNPNTTIPPMATSNTNPNGTGASNNTSNIPPPGRSTTAGSLLPPRMPTIQLMPPSNGPGGPTQPTHAHPQTHSHHGGPPPPPSSSSVRDANFSAQAPKKLDLAMNNHHVQHHAPSYSSHQFSAPSIQTGQFSPLVPSRVSVGGGMNNGVGNTSGNGPNQPHSIAQPTHSEDWAVYHGRSPNGSQVTMKVDLQSSLSLNSVVCCVRYSWDGQLLATGSNRSAHIFDAATGQLAATFSKDAGGSAESNNKSNGNIASKVNPTSSEDANAANDSYVRAVCFSPDGNWLITGAEDHVVKVWDVRHRKVKHMLRGHNTDIYSVDASANGRFIISGSGDKMAKLWSLETGELLKTLGGDSHGPTDGITSVSVAPASQYVAAGSLDKMVRVWDVETGRLVRQFEGHRDSVYSVAFSPDGRLVLSGSLDKTLKLWDLAPHQPSSQCRLTFSGHKDFVLSVAFSPNARWLISGSKDRSVQFWDPRQTAMCLMLHGHKNSVISIAHNPMTKALATGSGDCRARTWVYS